MHSHGDIRGSSSVSSSKRQIRQRGLFDDNIDSLGFKGWHFSSSIRIWMLSSTDPSSTFSIDYGARWDLSLITELFWFPFIETEPASLILSRSVEHSFTL